MIDGLLARLERDAEAEIARVGEDARAAAAAITAATDTALERRRAEALARLDATRRETLERSLRAARRAAQQQVLAARTRLLARVFAALEAALPDLGAGAAYRAALPAEFARAVAFTGERQVQVHCAPALAPALGPLKRNGRLTIRREPGIAAGFRITTAVGDLEVDATLTGRIERLRPQLAVAAMAALGTAEAG